MKIISRSEALALGLKRYFTGKPCRQGHVAERYAAGRDCAVCVRAPLRAWREANRDKENAYQRAWCEANRDKENALQATRRATKLKATPAWADHGAIAAVYAEADRLTRETGVPHHVDHIVPLQSPLVCGLHVHWNLRPLPASENIRKGNKLLEECHA